MMGLETEIEVETEIETEIEEDVTQCMPSNTYTIILIDLHTGT